MRYETCKLVLVLMNFSIAKYVSDKSNFFIYSLLVDPIFSTNISCFAVVFYHIYPLFKLGFD